MRGLSFILGKSAQFRIPSVPDGRLRRACPDSSDVVDDALRTAFDIACLNAELDAAADLLAVVEKRHKSRVYSHKAARDEGDQQVRRLRCVLDTKRLAQGSRPAAPVRSTEYAY